MGIGFTSRLCVLECIVPVRSALRADDRRNVLLTFLVSIPIVLSSCRACNRCDGVFYADGYVFLLPGRLCGGLCVFRKLERTHSWIVEMGRSAFSRSVYYYGCGILC